MPNIGDLLRLLFPPERPVEPGHSNFEFERITCRFRRVLTASRWIRTSDNTPVECHFAIVANDKPSAFAVEVQPGVHILAIHDGLLRALLTVFWRSVQHSEIHGGEEVSATLQPADRTLEGSDESVMAERAPLAVLLFRLAIEFLFYHELHHIVLGHTGLANFEKSRSRLYESGPSPLSSPASQRPMEFAADREASKSLFDSVTRRRLSLIEPVSLVDLELYELLYASVVAFLTLFCCLQYVDGRDNIAYPSVGARSLIFLNDWSRSIRRESVLTESLWTKILARAIRTVSLVFSELYDDVKLLFFFNDEKSIDQAFHELEQLAFEAGEQIESWQRFSVHTMPLY